MQEQAAAGFWLSPQQKSAWKFEQDVLRGSSQALCIWSLAGTVDPERLRGALREMVCRHEILRTVFRRQTGMKVPFQVVQDSAVFAWEQVDLCGLNSVEQESRIQKLWDAETTRQVNLENGPALSACLIKLAADHSSLILSVPVLCTDAQSLGVLARELGTIYSADRESLPEPFRYVQFAQWQADLLESGEEDAQQGRDFWAKQKEASLPSPSLPGESKANESSFQPGLLTAMATDLAPRILQRSDTSE